MDLVRQGVWLNGLSKPGMDKAQRLAKRVAWHVKIDGREGFFSWRAIGEGQEKPWARSEGIAEPHRLPTAGTERS